MAAAGKPGPVKETAAAGRSVARVGNGSLADQATRVLLDAVMSRRFPAGRLPPEPELAAQLAVSRTTLRTALQRLETAGLLSRAPARGTLVRPEVGRDTLALQRLIGFHELLEERGHDVRVAVTWEVRPHADDASVAALGLEPATPVLRSAKTFFADDRPAIFIWDEVPLAFLSPQLQTKIRRGRFSGIPDSIFAFSADWPHRAISHSIVEIEPAVAPDGAAGVLTLPEGAPLLVLAEMHYAGGVEPVAYSRIHVDDRFLRFRIVRHQ